MNDPKATTPLAKAKTVLAEYKRGRATELQLWETMFGLVADRPQSRTRPVLERMIARLRTEAA